MGEVKAAAITLAEAANLLMIPGRKVAPGEKSEAPGHRARGEEMDALIAKDPQAFYKHARDLCDAAMLAAQAADKDADKVFEVGERSSTRAKAATAPTGIRTRRFLELPVDRLKADPDRGRRTQGTKTNTPPQGRSPTFTRAFTDRLSTSTIDTSLDGPLAVKTSCRPARPLYPTAGHRLQSSRPAGSSSCR